MFLFRLQRWWIQCVVFTLYRGNVSSRPSCEVGYSTAVSFPNTDTWRSYHVIPDNIFLHGLVVFSAECFVCICITTHTTVADYRHLMYVAQLWGYFLRSSSWHQFKSVQNGRWRKDYNEAYRDKVYSCSVTLINYWQLSCARTAGFRILWNVVLFLCNSCSSCSVCQSVTWSMVAWYWAKHAIRVIWYYCVNRKRGKKVMCILFIPASGLSLVHSEIFMYNKTHTATLKWIKYEPSFTLCSCLYINQHSLKASGHPHSISSEFDFSTAVDSAETYLALLRVLDTRQSCDMVLSRGPLSHTCKFQQ